MIRPDLQMEFVNKLKVAAFQNGVRLYLDACLWLGYGKPLP